MSMKEMACSYSCYLALFCRSLPSFILLSISSFWALATCCGDGVFPVTAYFQAVFSALVRGWENVA